MEPVNGFSHHGVGCGKPDGRICPAEIVVNRLWHTHDWESEFGKCGMRDTQRILAAYGDQSFQSELIKAAAKVLKAVFLAQWVRPRRIKDGAAFCENTGDSYRGELHDPLLHGHPFMDESFPPVLDAHKAVRIPLAAVFHDGPDGCIESRTISAAGEHADIHISSFLDPIVAVRAGRIQTGKLRDLRRVG